MPLIKLTDWETGLPVYVDRDRIVTMRRLSAEVFAPILPGDTPHEVGERTRIDTERDTVLVREDTDEILRKDNTNA